MKLKVLLSFLLIYLNGFAQIATVDSLTNLLEAENTDTTKVKLLLNLSDEYNKTDIDESFQYALKALELSKNTGVLKWIAESNYTVGSVYLDLVNYDSSIIYLERAETIFEQINDKHKVVKVLHRKLYQVLNLADYDQAMEYGFQILRIAEELNDKKSIAEAYLKISDVLYYQEEYDEAINYSRKALLIFKQLDDPDGIANIYQNIGENYLIIGEYDSALTNINQALKIKMAYDSHPLEIGSLYNARGNIYKYLEEYDNALADYQHSFDICKELGFDSGIMATTANFGDVYTRMKEYRKALPYTLKAIEMMEESGNLVNIVENYGHAATAYEGIGDYKQAYDYYVKYAETRDSIFSVEKDHSMSELRTQYETEKKEEQIFLLEKEALLNAQAQVKDKQIRLLLIVVAFLLLLFAIGLWSRLRFVRKSRTVIQMEKDRSDNLLLNILPSEVAEELKENGESLARDFDDVTILFTDFIGFTKISESLSAKDLVAEIDTCFKAFDRIITSYGIEKIKTIGDAYMAAGGLHESDAFTAKNVVLAGLEMQAFIKERKEKLQQLDTAFFEMRVGIHSGPVVAGIVGVKKFQYDIWGDTVNIASRMENMGRAGKVNISNGTYKLIEAEPAFKIEARGKIEVKNKGEMKMFFVEHAVNQNE